MALEQVDNTKNAGESLHTGLGKYNALITELKAAAFILKSAATNFTAAVLHKNLSGADLHTPKAHKASHTNGTDDVQNATVAQKGLATAAQITKLGGIEASAKDDQTGAEILALFEALSAQAWNQQFNNLLKNGSFESWSAGVDAAPDGWTLYGAAATIAREAAIVKIGTYSAKLTRNGTNCGLHTSLAAYPVYLRGRVVTFGCWVYATVADRTRIRVVDDGGSSYSSYHPGDSTWRFLTVTRTVDGAATYVKGSGLLETGDTDVYFDGAILVEGTICPTFAQHPNDEHLKAIDFQNSSPANSDYGLLRMECGQTGAININDSLAITFGTAFTRVLTALAVGTGSNTTSDVLWTLGGIATTGFTIYNKDTSEAASAFWWIGIGVGS